MRRRLLKILLVVLIAYAIAGLAGLLLFPLTNGA